MMLSFLKWLKPTVYKNMVFMIPESMEYDKWTIVEGSIEDLKFVSETGKLHKVQTFIANLRIKKNDPDIYQ